MKSIYVFGEYHQDQESVYGIIREIIELNKTLRGTRCVLLEVFEDDDKKIYEKEGFHVFRLEPNIDRVKNVKSKAKEFLHREFDMINTISYYINRYDNVMVVVGDTHLRTTYCKVLGAPYLYEWLVKYNGSAVKVVIKRYHTPEIE